MSLTIKEARMATQGAGGYGVDQGGFIDFVKGVVGGVIGLSPAGQLAQKASGYLRRRGKRSARPGLTDLGLSDQRRRAITRAQSAAAARGDTAQARAFGRELGLQGRLENGVMPELPLSLQTGGGLFLTDTTPAIGCQSGYHPNKSDYYARSPAGTVIFVPKGARCVKNRKRNPLNPRALSRSMARITSAKAASSVLSRITIRSKCPTPSKKKK